MAFGRKVEVSIGPPGEIGNKFTGIRINFKIDKTLQQSPNQASVKLYNITRENALKIAKADNKLIVRAGYEDEGNVKSLFFGNVQDTT